MMRYLMPIFLLLITSCGGSSQNAKIVTSINVQEDPEVGKMIETFFQKYKDESPSNAVDFIFSVNNKVTNQQLLNVKEKLSSLNALAGSYEGYELITTQHAAKSLVFQSYLVKYDMQPIRIIFIFYRPKDKWKVYRFKIDDQVDTELEASGKVYYLNN